VVNQIIGSGMGDTYLKMKLKEQAASMRMLEESASLAPLDVIKGKMLDLEVKGIPALTFFASTLWAGMPTPPGSPDDAEGLVRSGALLLLPCCWNRDNVQFALYLIRRR
jgi:hypothetical protein